MQARSTVGVGGSHRRPSERAKGGFSLTELLVAVVAAAIVAITAGVLLHMTFASWTRGQSAVDVQRDLTAITQMLNGMVREASSTDVSGTSSQIQVVDGAVTKRLSHNSGAGSVVYDPDTGTSGDEVTIVSANVQTFTPTVTGTGVRLEVAVQNSDESSSINAFVSFRN